MPYKLRRTNLSRKHPNQDLESQRNIISNEERDKSRDEQRALKRQRAADEASAKIGDYVEKRFLVASGKKEMFRGQLVYPTRRGGSNDHGGNYKVRWLVDSTCTNEDIFSREVCLLGSLHTPPAAIRTRAEGQDLTEKQRQVGDITKIERELRSHKRSAGMSTHNEKDSLKCAKDKGTGAAKEQGQGVVLMQGGCEGEVSAVTIQDWFRHAQIKKAMRHLTSIGTLVLAVVLLWRPADSK